MDSTTNMSPIVTFLIFLVVFLLIRGCCDDHSLDRRANVPKRTNNDSNYNIYTKINTLQKDSKNLETKLQKRTKLLLQVLRSVLEMDINLEMSSKDQKKQTILA